MEAPYAPVQPLPDDALVMLDPAVEILETKVDEFSLLCQSDLALGMAVPPGEGLLDFVRSLMGQPIRVGALREEYDDRKLIDEMLTSLLARGFADVASHDGPPAARTLRRPVMVDLDAIASVEALCALWNAGETAPEVLLHCSRLSDHNALLRELAQRRAARTLRAHHVIVRAPDVRCDGDAREFLVRLGAAVEIDGVEWPAPHGSIPGLAELTRALIATHAIMTPDASILDESVRERCVGWCRSEFVSGLCLRLAPSATTEEEFAGILNAVRSLKSFSATSSWRTCPAMKCCSATPIAGGATRPTRDIAFASLICAGEFRSSKALKGSARGARFPKWRTSGSGPRKISCQIGPSYFCLRRAVRLWTFAAEWAAWRDGWLQRSVRTGSSFRLKCGGF